jgi:hypothetical protein
MLPIMLHSHLSCRRGVGFGQEMTKEQNLAFGAKREVILRWIQRRLYDPTVSWGQQNSENKITMVRMHTRMHTRMRLHSILYAVPRGAFEVGLGHVYFR